MAGYVTGLDIYLDSAWSGVYQGNYSFSCPSNAPLVSSKRNRSGGNRQTDRRPVVPKA
jgi:hypothetical protein